MKLPRPTLPRSSWLLLLVVAVVAFALGRGGSGRGGSDDHGSPATTAADAGAPTLWTCSMHPQIILPSNDQKCPICFMDLIPLQTDQGEGLGPADLRLSPSAMALAEIRTAPVQRRPVARPLRLVGKVSADETLERTITARFGGRLDRLHVDATGEIVRAGDPLADIYSPQLYAAQTELRTAAAAAADDPSAAATLEAAAGRLRLLGLDQRQIDAIRAGRAAAEHLTVTAPLGGVVIRRVATAGAYVKTGDELYAIADLSRVWVRLHAFEADVPWLRTGQPVALATRAWPGRAFAGTIAFIDPVLDQKTRSVEVRVAVDNADGALKPGMLASGVVEAGLDARGRAVAPGAAAADPLVIPATAPLLTGTRAVVYVKLPDRDEPVFQGRQIDLGPRAGDWYVVASGLEAGEEVVVEGAFKIDSALQIQAKPAMMSLAVGGNDADAAAAPAAEVGPLVPGACLQAGLVGVLEAYLPLQAALAADDDAKAAAAAADVVARLAAIACAVGPPPPGDAVWSGLAPRLAEVARAVAAADGIAARRLAFEPLSDGLWIVLDRFGIGEVRPVRRFHCPMALDGAGANWLQDGTVTANPYYGAAMLRCGSQTAALGQVDRAGGN